MRYFICFLLFWVTGPAYSNGFRVCGWPVGSEEAARIPFDLESAQRSQFAVHISWLSFAEGANGQIRHCGGALVSRQWVLTARHCVGEKRWQSMIVSAPHLKFNTTGEIAICPTAQLPFPKEDVALLRLLDPVPEGTGFGSISEQIKTFPSSGHIARWPVRRGTPNGSLMISPITIDGITPSPMLSGKMVYRHERVPCGGESGSMLIDEEDRLLGVLSAISSPEGGRPNCNDPDTRIFLTPLSDWRGWVEAAILSCEQDPERCSKPE